MATFGWSYKSNVCGVKRPKEQGRKAEEWQKTREDVKVPLHAQTHSAESLNAGMKRRRFNPHAKIYIGNLSKDTKAVNPHAKIYIGNLSKDTKAVTLAEYFSFFGEIAYMKLVKDRETGISRGFAFITFVEVEAAAKATRWCRHNHPRIDDREIKVGLAERRRRQDMTHNQHGESLRNDTKAERRDTHTLYWEYKWSQDPDAEVYGPYETSLMLQWAQADYFRAGCWVRQAVRAHIAPERADNDCIELPLNHSQNNPTSLVGSYSSSEEEEESETETETKRAKLECPQSDTTGLDQDDTETPPSPSPDENTNNKLETNLNQDVKQNKCIEYNNDGQLRDTSKENSVEKKTKDKVITTKEISQQHNINIAWQSNSHSDDEADETRYQQDPAGSWYEADRGGYKPRDLLGRDSSSEDEDVEYYEMDSQNVQKENEFVSISDIDFSMFP